MICTRLDIAQAVGPVSRFMEYFGRENWSAMKRILRYIKGMSGVALCFEWSKFIFRGYVDSNFIGNLDKRKSIVDYVFTLAKRAMSWLSKLQIVVALSTVEELRHKQQKIIVYCDNQNSLLIARNPTIHSRIKPIGVQ